MRIPRTLFLVTYGIPAIAAVIFAVTVWVPPLLADSMRIPALWAYAAGFVLSTFAGSYMLALREYARIPAMRVAFAPVMLAAASFAMFLYVESDVSRVLTAAAAVGLIGAHAAFVAGLKAPARYRKEDLKHIAFMVRIVASFFAFTYAFALPTISRMHPGIVMVLMAAWVAVVAWETLHDEAFSSAPPRALGWAFAALGAQCYAGLSALPLVPHANAAVALALLAVSVSTATLALRGAAPPLRNVAIATAAILAILASSRWT